MKKLAFAALLASALAAKPAFSQTNPPVPDFAGLRSPCFSITLTGGAGVCARGVVIVDQNGNPVTFGNGGSSQATTAAPNSYQSGFSPDIGKTTDAPYADTTGQAAGSLIAANKGQFVALSQLAKQLVFYTLATGATSAGNVTPNPGTYALNLPSAFNGATATVTFTASNGASSTATYTAAPTVAPRFDIYAGSTVSVSYSGGTPTGNTTLSGGPTNPFSTPVTVYDPYNAPYTYAPVGGSAESYTTASATFSAGSQADPRTGGARAWYAVCPAGTANTNNGSLGALLTLTGVNGGTRQAYVTDGNNGPFPERLASYTGNAVQGTNATACTIGDLF